MESWFCCAYNHVTPTRRLLTVFLSHSLTLITEAQSIVVFTRVSQRTLYLFSVCSASHRLPLFHYPSAGHRQNSNNEYHSNRRKRVMHVSGERREAENMREQTVRVWGTQARERWSRLGFSHVEQLCNTPYNLRRLQNVVAGYQDIPLVYLFVK